MLEDAHTLSGQDGLVYLQGGRVNLGQPNVSRNLITNWSRECIYKVMKGREGRREREGGGKKELICLYSSMNDLLFPNTSICTHTCTYTCTVHVNGCTNIIIQC